MELLNFKKKSILCSIYIAISLWNVFLPPGYIVLFSLGEKPLKNRM